MLHTGSDCILCGCLLAIGIARYPHLCRKLLLPSWAMGGLVLYFYLISPLLKIYLPRQLTPLLLFSLMALTITVFLANVLLQTGPTWYHRLLENRALVFIGRISYSVYLWQQLFMNENRTWMGTWPLSIVLGLAVGYLSYRFIETPFLRLKDKFAVHTRKEPATLALAT
jgi:peptidoglycan/LPS O-acetylase OafA/YrhL